MALIVEDGTGKTDAESFVSVATVQAYYDARANMPAGWDAATTADQENAARSATEYLQTRYGRRWKGTRNTRDQALDFPRTGVCDLDGFTIGADSIPAALADATSYLAIRAIDAALVVDVASPGGVKRTKKELGPLKTEVEYTGSGGQQKEFTIVRGFLRHLIESGARVVKGA